MPKFSVKKPLTVFVTALAIIILGIVAYLKMTPDLLPNMNFPYVIIITANPGASPEAVESQVTRPLEQSMATLDEIKSITSTSQNSVSMVALEFEDSVNMDSISVDIQQKLSALQGSWDDTVSAPYVLKINPSMLPVQVAAISYSGKDVHEMSEFVEETLADKLTGITGVASVDITGTVARQLHVLLSQEKLDQLSKKLLQAIEAQLEDAAGQLYSTRWQLQSAKNAIRDGSEAALQSAAEQALISVQQSLAALRQSRDELEANISELLSIQGEKVVLDAQNAQYHFQMEAIRQNGSLTDEEKAEQLAAIESDPAYLQVQADLAILELRLAALNTTWATMGEKLQQWQTDLDNVQQQLGKLENQDSITEIADQVSSGVMTLADGVTQLLSASVQLDSALTQIEQGLSTLQSSREDALAQADLSSALNINVISALLTAQNFSMPAGYITEDGVQYMVSVGDSIDTQADLEDMILFDLKMEGMDPIRLKDVADVFITDNAADIYAKLNGENGVIATFTKQSTYATAEVSENIRQRFDELEAEHEGLSFVALMDQGDYIYLIINSILSSLGWGIVFSVIILWIFLRDLRPTFITLCSIPISLIFAVVLMYFSGVTINMISLSGLAVSVGMLVDNSIVVIENIYRLRNKGATVIQAAVSGTQQVLGAIAASTLTTVCVFVPIVFVEGLTRQLFTDLALTMTFSLMASLIVALTLVPAMASGMLRKAKPQKPGILDKIYPAYRKTVAWSLGHRAIVLLLAAALLVGSAGMALSRGFTFMPSIDMNTLTVTIAMPEGIERDEAVALADEVLRRAATVEHVQTVGATMSSGDATTSMMMGMSGGAYDVTAYVIVPEGESGAKAGKAIEELCADLKCTVTATGAMDSMTTMMTGSGVSLQVYGENMESLQEAARLLAARMETAPGTTNVSDGLQDAVEALHISIDRDAAMRKGMTVAQIYLQVAAALVDSATSADMTLDGMDVGVSIQNPEESRMTREKLMDLEITVSSSSSTSSSDMSSMMGSSSGISSMMGGSSASSMSSMTSSSSGTGGESFKLSEVATIHETVSLNSISHSDQRRYVTVSAEIAEGYNITKVSADVQEAVRDVKLPAGVKISFSGENEMILEAMKQLVLMLLLGIVLVYFIMVAQFQSLKSPFIVMFTIPLAFTGGFMALLIAHIEVSVISLIGFVMLVGIIVNNGIVLVDYINQLRLEGMERRDAIIEAGVTRLRPILMTTMTTILGLIVMALAQNVGTSFMQPVALVCIGGLTYATLMTLLVVPCMYDIVARKELRAVDASELEILNI